MLFHITIFPATQRSPQVRAGRVAMVGEENSWPAVALVMIHTIRKLQRNPCFERYIILSVTIWMQFHNMVNIHIYIYINLIIYVSQILQYFVYVYVYVYIYIWTCKEFFSRVRLACSRLKDDPAAQGISSCQRCQPFKCQRFRWNSDAQIAVEIEPPMGILSKTCYVWRFFWGHHEFKKSQNSTYLSHGTTCSDSQTW